MRVSAPAGRPEMSMVGRDDALAQVAALRTSAGGSFAAVVVVGEAGIGKTSLAEAAARAALGDGWTSVWVQGVESDVLLAHGGLLSLMAPLRRHLALLPETQRAAMSAVLGWADADVRGERFLVGAATMSLLAVAAEEQPLMVVVDDLQWLDRESAEAILFAARRLRHDRVCFLLTMREGSTPPVAIDDCNAYRLTGLSMEEVTRLLGPGYAPAVVGRLTRETAGNPLALVECGRVLSSVQRAGAAELPDSLPVPDRLRRLYSDELARLTPEAWFAVRLAAASHDQAAGPIVAALTHAGLEPGSCLEQAADVVRLVEGGVVFRHPLVRSAAWGLASAGSDARRTPPSLRCSPPGRRGPGIGSSRSSALTANWPVSSPRRLKWTGRGVAMVRLRRLPNERPGCSPTSRRRSRCWHRRPRMHTSPGTRSGRGGWRARCSTVPSTMRRGQRCCSRSGCWSCTPALSRRPGSCSPRPRASPAVGC